jgi:hypothetical protein
LSDGRSLILSLAESRQAHPTWFYAAELILNAAKTGKRADLIDAGHQLDAARTWGRSPGKGDAVVMAWSEGNRAAMARQQKKPLPHRPASYSSHPQAWMG